MSSARSVQSVSASFALLTELVSEAKVGAPFAPVTIIVPSHRSGLDVTRHLARTVADERGVVNVHAHTLADVAALLHETSGAGTGRSLVSSLIRQGAVQSILAEHPGDFAKVADQPATAAALSSASSTLDVVDISVAKSAAPSALAQEVLRVHTAVQAKLAAGWFTQHDQFTGALHALETDAASLRNSLGTVIAFLMPRAEDLDIDARQLLSALETEYAATVIALAVDPSTISAQVVNATDADDEARVVVRRVVELISQGTPANRIGVFWGSEQPYRALLHRHFAEAAVAVNGPSARQLHDTSILRGMRALLTLDPADIDIRVVFDVLAEGVLNWGEERLPSSAQCEMIYGTTLLSDPDDDADASSVRGVQFVDSASLSEESTDVLAEHNPKREALASRQRLIERYLKAVASSLTQVEKASTWLEASEALESFVAEHFEPRPSLDQILEHTLAREGLHSAIVALRMLDGVAPAPSATAGGSLVAAAAALDSELNNHSLRHSKTGIGVGLGSLNDGAARDLDVVMTVGLAEGIAPGRHRDDPLLPDEVRELWGDLLPSLVERIGRQKRGFQAALASARTARVVSYPRGDLRGGGDRMKSRWLEDFNLTDIEEAGSFHDGMVVGNSPSELPTTSQQWRLRQLRAQEGTQVPAPMDQVLDDAWSMRRARAQGEFGRFTGDVSSLADKLRVFDQPVTPTSLEDWVTSPLSYFLGHILGVRMFEDVQLSVEIDVLTRGTLLHEVLEKFVIEQLNQEQESGAQSRLLELADEAFDEFGSAPSARNWLAHLWERDKRSMRTDLRLWWERTSSTGVSAHSAEASFGHSNAEHDSVPFTLADGTAIRFSGKVDRIDWGPDGSVRVVDYKAGKADAFKSLSADNPTAGGTKFQLPIYGLFAQREAADADMAGSLHAEYDFVTRKGGQKTIGYEVTDDVLETLRTDVGEVVAAIRSGIFPPAPGPTSFRSFTTLMGAHELKHLWGRVKQAPALAPLIHFWPSTDGDA